MKARHVTWSHSQSHSSSPSLMGSKCGQNRTNGLPASFARNNGHVGDPSPLEGKMPETAATTTQCLVEATCGSAGPGGAR